MWQVKLALSAACLCAAVSHVQAVGKNLCPMCRLLVKMWRVSDRQGLKMSHAGN